MTQDQPTTEFERRLTEGLARLAERATTSPDALERILSAEICGERSIGAPADAGRGGSKEDDGKEVALVVTLTQPSPPAPRQGKRPGTRAIAPILALAAAVVVAALIIGPGTGTHGVGPAQRLRAGGAPGTTAPAPITGGPGATRLAWIANGTLYIGATSGARAAHAIGTGLNPEWSADGKWLAYLVAEPDSSYQIRVVRSDGTDDHEVLGAAGFAAFLWSPTIDEIGAVPLSAAGNSAGLVVIGTTGSPRYVLASSIPVDSMMWSQDGTQLAYSGPQGVSTVPASGGASTAVPYSPPAGATVVLAGWWPGDRGLLLWPDKPGAVEADGLPLVAVPLQGGPAQTLARTQVYLSWLAWSPDGSQLALVAGGGSIPSEAKSIRLCAPPVSSAPGSSAAATSWSCHSLPQPSGTVSLDPAWSPGSRQISFVRAIASSGSAQFFASRTLFVADADGSHAHRVAVSGGSSGAVLPVWSLNGSDIGYSTGSSIVLAPPGGGPAQILASGLSGSYQGSSVGTDSYGKAPWGGSAAWDTGPGSAADGDT